MPSIRGISTSSVRRSGDSSTILSRATYGSGAVPTTSIKGSLAPTPGRGFACTTAESSTIRTRTRFGEAIRGWVRQWLE